MRSSCSKIPYYNPESPTVQETRKDENSTEMSNSSVRGTHGGTSNYCQTNRTCGRPLVTGSCVFEIPGKPKEFPIFHQVSRVGPSPYLRQSCETYTVSPNLQGQGPPPRKVYEIERLRYKMCYTFNFIGSRRGLCLINGLRYQTY